jgi:tetratricopeptide (TPR) repeat protein
MRVVNWYWDGLLGRLIDLLDKHFEIEVGEGTPTLAVKIGVSALALFLLIEICVRIRDAIQQYLDSKKKFVDVTLVEDVQSPLIDSIEAAKHPDLVIKPLIKQKKYARVAAIYASLNQPKEAAKFYKKAGDLKSAAESLALVGKTADAAKLLMKQGDYLTAARFYDEIGDHAKAAKAHQLAGQPAKAALANAKAGKPEAALAVFADYFANAGQDPPERQLEMADACYAALRDEVAENLDDDARKPLFAEVAQRFMQAGRSALAADCYEQAGDYYRAAYAYLQMKKPEQAAGLLQQMDSGHPDFVASRAMLARSYYDFRDYAQCVATLAPLIQGQTPSPSNLDLFYLLALTQEQQGKIDLALKTLNAIRAVKPQYGDLAKRIPALQARLQQQSG